MKTSVYNPQGLSQEDLPVIYGFNNGGAAGWFDAVLLAEDGVFLGSHICSHEGFMPGDLGVLEGSRPDRHETFRQHYPGGYRMAFIGYEEVSSHEGLKTAIAKVEERKASGQDLKAGDEAGFACVSMVVVDDEGKERTIEKKPI